MWDIAGIFTAYITAKLTSIPAMFIGIATEIGKFLGQTLFLVWLTEGLELLASAIASFIMGIVAIKIDIALGNAKSFS
ncbi:hypothetical protein DRO49_04930 [Candidatus Bathyarchaeota archaeon]|nr:MAG: hypothetical protein DRO49_04930 [Candidatus Bathyarchaeota archaeon]